MAYRRKIQHNPFLYFSILKHSYLGLRLVYKCYLILPENWLRQVFLFVLGEHIVRWADIGRGSILT
jgi:hypothetical protein